MQLTKDSSKPRTYLDRPGVSPSTEFLFISYSHRSHKVVYEDLEKLYEAGLNYWYDTDLRKGDDWLQVVESKLNDPWCRGVIFFFDTHSLSGDAIEKEIDLYERLARERSDFSAFCLLNEGQSVYSIVRDALANLKDLNPKELETALPEQRIVKVLKAFNKDKIYVNRHGSYIEEIVRDARKISSLLISDEQGALDTLVSAFKERAKFVDNCFEITFGHYPHNRLEKKSFLFQDGKFHSENGRRTYDCYDSTYDVQPLTWLVLEASMGRAKLVTKFILDSIEGDPKTVEEWLESFQRMAFTESEQKVLIQQPRLLRVADLSLAQNKIRRLIYTDFAKGSVHLDGLTTVWLEDLDGLDSTKRKNLCGSVSEIEHAVSYGYIDNICGVMPIIEIDINTLKEVI